MEDDKDKRPIIVIINNDRHGGLSGGWSGSSGFWRIGYFFWIVRRIIGFLFIGAAIVFIIIVITKPEILYNWFYVILKKLGLWGIFNQFRRIL
jgi:hypothetical protein